MSVRNLGLSDSTFFQIASLTTANDSLKSQLSFLKALLLILVLLVAATLGLLAWHVLQSQSADVCLLAGGDEVVGRAVKAAVTAGGGGGGGGEL